MKKLPLRARHLLRKHQRMIRELGVCDARGWPVPVFESRVLNTAIWRYGNEVIAQRTHRKRPLPSIAEWSDE